jgi:hypothetical protein
VYEQEGDNTRLKNVCTSPTSSTRRCTAGLYDEPVGTVGSSELRRVRLRKREAYGRQTTGPFQHLQDYYNSPTGETDGMMICVCLSYKAPIRILSAGCLIRLFGFSDIFLLGRKHGVFLFYKSLLFTARYLLWLIVNSFLGV